ncbi:MAG: hypothetical protein LBO80_05960 [Treponema sp.]|jgi:hypothetical protein|nr:hypothetical protein [Treponema sp.]
MRQKTDWMPGRRTDQLAVCRNWSVILTAETRTAWGIPQAQYNELLDILDTAQDLLQKAESSERTPVITEQCKEAFEALTGKMRFFKGHFFLKPPLANADLVRLGLTPRRPPSPILRPEAQVEADLAFPGIHLVELQNIRAVGTFGLPDPRSDYGVRIYYGLSGPPSDKYRFRLTGDPKTGADLPYSLFTRRRRERFDFDGESGNRVWFCLRYENPKGEAGPFGPILTAVIP